MRNVLAQQRAGREGRLISSSKVVVVEVLGLIESGIRLHPALL
jgi:hypothetical protein